MITDLSYLREISDGNEEFVLDIVHTFLEETPNEIELIQQYLQTKDFASLRAIVHKWKSSVPFLGVEELNEIVPKLEKNARDGIQAELIHEQSLRVIDLLNEALEELKKLFGS